MGKNIITPNIVSCYQHFTSDLPILFSEKWYQHKESHSGLCAAGSPGSASHRQRPGRAGKPGPLQHPSWVELCPQPHCPWERRLLWLPLFFSPKIHQQRLVRVCRTVSVFDLCVCLVIRCDSQPGAPVSLGAPPWFLFILTDPLCASCAAWWGFRTN